MDMPNIFDRIVKIKIPNTSIYLTIYNNYHLILENIKFKHTLNNNWMFFSVKIKNDNGLYLSMNNKNVFNLHYSLEDDRIIIDNGINVLCHDYTTHGLRLSPIGTQCLNHFVLEFL